VVISLTIFLLIFYPKFKRWREARTLNAVTHFVAGRDYRSAYLLLDQFVKDHPGHFEARRMLARVYEVGGPDQALAEWEALTKAEPGNAENFIGYLQTALRARRTEQVVSMLAALRALQPDSLEYHRLSAGYALVRADATALRLEVEALARREPDNAATRITLALLMLKSSSPADVAAARGVLEEFVRSAGPWRIRAGLALAADTAVRWPDQPDEARRIARLARQLGLVEEGSVGTARPLNLNELAAASALRTFVAHLQAQSPLEPAEAARLTQWQLRRGLAREALLWLETLEPALRESLPVRGARAACAVQLESWDRLARLLREGAWGPVPTDVLADAFAARDLDARGRDSQSDGVWSRAVQVAGPSLPALRALYRLAVVWRWPDRQEQVLRSLVREAPGEEWAWYTLVQLGLAAGDENAVWRTYEAWVRTPRPTVPARIERAMLGLLVRPHERGLANEAAELFAAHPALPASRVTQALALWRAGQGTAAADLLGQPGIDFDQEPRFALVRALVLGDAVPAAEREKWLDFAATARLLPAERALIASRRVPRG